MINPKFVPPRVVDKIWAALDGVERQRAPRGMKRPWEWFDDSKGATMQVFARYRIEVVVPKNFESKNDLDHVAAVLVSRVEEPLADCVRELNRSLKKLQIPFTLKMESF